MTEIKEEQNEMVKEYAGKSWYIELGKGDSLPEKIDCNRLSESCS